MSSVCRGIVSAPPRKLVTAGWVVFVLTLLNLNYVTQTLENTHFSLGASTRSRVFLGDNATKAMEASPGVPLGSVPTCGGATHAASRRVWLEAEARYSHLTDDKFTIAILTYKRPDELAKTLDALLTDKVPSLHEIVVAWNEIEKAPPADFVSGHGVPVRYRVSERNSMNAKFVPDPAYETQAILLHDDDIWWKPDDLEFAFRAWRHNGRYRMTGALPRCHEHGPDGELRYAQCGDGFDAYSMVLSNLAFLHISFLDHYSSDDPIAARLRAKVDDVFNCDDLAVNFLVAMLTCAGPLHVMGAEHYVGLNPKVGISTNPNHLELRHECLNHFADVIGFTPLVMQYGSIRRKMPFYG